MSQHLRDYQVATADGIEAEWDQHDSTLAVLATGLGKTVIFAEIIRRRKEKGRALVLAHREELIFQAKKKIEHFTGIECEIEMADLVASTSMFHQMPVVIATIQTLNSGRKTKRRERFKPEDFATVILDEAHHGIATTWKKVIDYFKTNPAIKILGVTATPDRHDEEAMGQIFQSVAANIGIMEGIEMGWLVPISQQMVVIEGLDFSDVKTTAGDLNGAELAAIMEAEKNLHGLCSSTLEIIGNRQTIAFTASVKHAEAACNIFNRHREGIAEWICGETPKEARRKTMANMANGRTQILCNVGVATEGFDCPGVEVIIMGRPTKSRSLYAQMAGRATRPLPGVVDGLDDSTSEVRRRAISDSPKTSALIVDFVGNSGRHKLVTTLDLLGGKYSDEERELAHEMIEEEGSKDTQEALEAAKKEIARRRAKEMEEKVRLEEERKKRIKAKAKFSAKFIDPFNVFQIQPEMINGKPVEGVLTAREKEILGWNNVDYENMPYSEAIAVKRECDRRHKLGLCTLKQARVMKNAGISPDISKAEAGWAMGVLIKQKESGNGWHWPSNLPKPGTQAKKESAVPVGVIEQENFF